MKKTQLTKKDIERIELKFECLRRSEEYSKDYQKIQKINLNNKKNYEKLERFIYPKWFHFPLLKPDVPIDYYRNKKKGNYAYWLEKTLGGLISSDSLSPQSIKVVSRQLRKYLKYKKQGYKNMYIIESGKLVKTRLGKEQDIYNELDIREVEKELRGIMISLDLKSFTTEEIKQQVVQLLKELKPLANRILYGKHSSGKRFESIRYSYIRDYLKTYETKQLKQWREITDSHDSKRKYQKHIRAVKLLINGGWHSI